MLEPRVREQTRVMQPPLLLPCITMLQILWQKSLPRVALGSVQHPTYINHPVWEHSPSSNHPVDFADPRTDFHHCLRRSKMGAKNLTRGILPHFDT